MKRSILVSVYYIYAFLKTIAVIAVIMGIAWLLIVIVFALPVYLAGPDMNPLAAILMFWTALFILISLGVVVFCLTKEFGKKIIDRHDRKS